MRELLAVCALAALSGCAPSKPPRWAEGGVPLWIAPARWVRGDQDSVEIRADGQVLEGGKLRFVVDRVGRVADEDYDAWAVLEPDGSLIGTDNQPLGYIGISNASPPWAMQAWLAVQPDGTVVFFGSDGERSAGGRWAGCDGPQHRSCTLVTQLFSLKNMALYPSSRVTVGVGIGVGF